MSTHANVSAALGKPLIVEEVRASIGSFSADVPRALRNPFCRQNAPNVLRYDLRNISVKIACVPIVRHTVDDAWPACLRHPSTHSAAADRRERHAGVCIASDQRSLFMPKHVCHERPQLLCSSASRAPSEPRPWQPRGTRSLPPSTRWTLATAEMRLRDVGSVLCHALQYPDVVIRSSAPQAPCATTCPLSAT